MIVVAKEEGKTPEFICRGIASGRVVIPRSPYRFTKPVGIGKGLRTKVNASIGTSSDIVDVEMELEKARMAEKTGADTVMELSTGGDFHEIRRRVVEATSLSVGSVPLYQAFIEAIRKYGSWNISLGDMRAGSTAKASWKVRINKPVSGKSIIVQAQGKVSGHMPEANWTGMSVSYPPYSYTDAIGGNGSTQL